MRRTVLFALIALSLILPAGASVSAGAPTPTKITVKKFGVFSVGNAGSVGPDAPGPRTSEIPAKKRLGSDPLRSAPAAGDSVPLAPGAGTVTSSGKRAKSNPEVVLSFEGLNHRNSRLAFGGNQYSGEPADQGVCAGNGFILETVNSVLRVFDANTGARGDQASSHSTSFTASRRRSPAPRARRSDRSRLTWAATSIQTPAAGSTWRSTSIRTPPPATTPARIILTWPSARRATPPETGTSIASRR